jgi:integrase
VPDRKKLPQYCLHKGSGQAYVRLDGKIRYLGVYDSPESKTRYKELTDAWRLREEPGVPVELRVGELVLLFLEFAKGHYRKHGEPTSELGWIESACRYLMPDRGLRVADFGPRRLKSARERMVAAGLSRPGINSRVIRIKRMFRWAVAEELIPPAKLVALEALAPLEKGRSAARETKDVGPVPDEHVELVLPYLSDPLRRAVEILRLTGARSDEVLSMRVGDIDVSGEVWCYRPRRHKTEHLGHVRQVLIGPKGQEVLRPLLVDDPDAFVFRPIEGRRDRVGKGPNPPGERYNRHAIRTAVRRACQKVNLAREAAGLDPVPLWHPHQLRHAAADRFQREAGLVAAQATLGHARVDSTEGYVTPDLTAARTLIAEIG